jgi:hypothetical protein
MRKLTVLFLLIAAAATQALSGNSLPIFGGNADLIVSVPLGRCCYTDAAGAPACQMLPQLECSLLTGQWTANATCEDPCDQQDCVVCDSNSISENEPCPSFPDIVNGGCNNPGAAPFFSQIGCGEVICGTAWARPNGTVPGYVDHDSYLFTLTQQTLVRFCLRAEYAVLVELWETAAASPCGGESIARSDADSCQEVCLERCLPAGTYIFNTQPVFGQSLECGRYRLEMECSPCQQPCAECPPNAIHEDESCDPGALINTNGGCFVEPHTFTRIECYHAFCGTAWLLKETDSTGTFDIDAYQVIVSTPTRLTYCIAADFNVSFALVSHSDTNCFGNVLYSADTTACDTACFSECVPPGVYDFYVVGLPRYNESFFCGQYVAHLACEPCTLDTCQGTPAVYFFERNVPQCECAYFCPGTTVPIWVCGDAANRSRPPVITITPGCSTPDRGSEHCAEVCDPISSTAIAFNNSNWVWDDSAHCWKNYIVSYSEGCACICLENFLAVELQTFSAVSGDGSVTLNWQTASESDNDHFEILRNGHTASNSINATNNPSGSHYSWTDRTVTNGFNYTYELVAVDLNGVRTTLGTTNATPVSNTVEVITEYALRQNYPNPFNPVTSIGFDLVESGMVTLKVFNPLGQEVATVVSGSLSSGRHTVTFDASYLPSGMYLYRLETNSFSATKKMLLMK